MNEVDGLEPIPCQPWTSRLPKMAQPDLDFTGKWKINFFYLALNQTSSN